MSNINYLKLMQKFSSKKKKSTPKYINISIKVTTHKIGISGVCGWTRFYTNIKNGA
jgi:hypothetical protein